MYISYLHTRFHKSGVCDTRVVMSFSVAVYLSVHGSFNSFGGGEVFGTPLATSISLSHLPLPLLSQSIATAKFSAVEKLVACLCVVFAACCYILVH